MDEVMRAEEALTSISPDLPYDDWMKVGMGAQAAGISLEFFDQWSAGSSRYEKSAVRSLWKSFRPDKGISDGTLFFYAMRYGGWKPPKSFRVSLPAKTEEFDLQRFIRNTMAKRPTVSTQDSGIAEAIWNRCQPASTNHSYIERKGGEPGDLRVVPEGDEFKILGERMEGALVIPVQRADGSISSLQFITVDDTEARLKAAGRPTKLNLPQATMEGWYMVGEPLNHGRIFVCEGIGQAWSCWQATGHAAAVAFGWGRVPSVAQALQQKYPGAQLVLVPDKGKEAKAMAHAAELGCHVATMPEVWPNNSDVNDLALSEGADTLGALLDLATGPKLELPASTHPLAKYVDYDCQPRAPKWVIPGFIGHGVVIIAGAHGVGKTTALLPLAMTAAGLHAPSDALAPKHWRHVVYIVEDIEQAKRILAGMVGFSSIGLDPSVVKQRLHLVEAARLTSEYVASVGKEYEARFTRIVDGVAVLPLVVLDTKAAVIAMENENDNAEASQVMAHLKQGFEGLPTWIIGHVAKHDIGRSDISTLTTRGGSSLEADANQVLYLIKEASGTRYLVRGKTRFEAKWAELEIDTQCAETEALNEYGELEPVVMRWGIPMPPALPRQEAAAKAKANDIATDHQHLMEEIFQIVDMEWQKGLPLNREGVKGKLNRGRNVVVEALNQLIQARRLFEVEVPAKQRTNSKRSHFLVALTEAERQSLLQDGVLPEGKMGIPPCWRKPTAETPVQRNKHAKTASTPSVSS